MAKTTEQVLGNAVIKVLLGQPSYEGTVRTLIKNIPTHVKLTPEDEAPSKLRIGESMWEQRVRNLKSHDKTAGNVIAEGYVENVSKGRYRLTKAGLLHATHKGWV